MFSVTVVCVVVIVEAVVVVDGVAVVGVVVLLHDTINNRAIKLIQIKIGGLFLAGSRFFKLSPCILSHV